MRYTTTKRGGMILKLDLEKAYDRLEWSFVEETLTDACIPRKLIRVILKIFQGSSCRLLWNREATKDFKPTRRLQQGNPLSLYIFVMCMQRLSSWIQKEVDTGRWKSLKTSRGGTAISHLFFADGILLFAKETEAQVECILEGINKIYRASGQRINFGKSTVLFSSNFSEDESLRLSTKLGVKQTKELGVYLGHNVHHQGRSNRASDKLLERLRERLDGRKSKTVPLDGRLTLAKSVINTMGVFTMQVQQRPTSVHKKLDNYVKRCVWGDFDTVRKMHLLSWDV